MEEKAIREFFKSFIDNYEWSLIARSGRGNHTDDTYCYIFIDDVGINITINPNNKGFAFFKSVNFMFKFISDEFSPFDYPNHFEKNYLKFRKIVIEKQLS